MADYTSTGYQANVNRGSSGGSGGGTIINVGGRSFSSNSPEGQQFLAQQQQNRLSAAKKTLGAQTNLATAEVEADAQDFEAEQNREAGQQAFQYALSQAGSKRQPGGGIARGGSGRRGMTLNQATGGLAAANAAARKKAQMGLAQARVAADPENLRLQQQIAASQASLARNPAAGSARKPISAPNIGR
jgi:hypothetical protein